MTIVLDTSILIDHLRGNTSAHSALLSALKSNNRLVASVATKIEVLAGMRSHETQATRRLLDSLEWIAVDDTIAETAGLLANTYLASHPGVDPIVHIIAATCVHMNADLWTRNLKHFPMFPQLKSPY